EYLIINGVECEPYLTADHRLMLEKADEILEGIRIVQKIVGMPEVRIAVEINKPDAIETLERKILERGLEFQVVPLKVRYPQGDEKMVLKAVLDREVPRGGLPLDVGAVVSNVGTVYAVYEAIVWRKPLIERICTVTGQAVARPANLKVRIGTPIGEVLEDCGGFQEPPVKVVLGGPMMGFAAVDLSTPVTKGVSGIIALGKKEAALFQGNPCIRCGRCMAVCPWGLFPTVLYKLIENQEYAAAWEEGLPDCKECGCCAYVCPSRIPLVQAFKYGKLMSRKK
ncbi:MAG TPA: RnfABCDGE type electron transport complex subunit C, partial [Spirochaetia bacterium]|nr:RnfABCDGE type electron transport complex subunit C [Spirochaetia bacterium]